MIIDAHTLPNGTLIDADICIIGAGPAGISLAREFDGEPFRVVLLEGGGRAFNRAGQALYCGENIGVSYEDIDEMRSRYLGGCSNCWGGFCRPLDPHDFQPRDWVPNSGWPFGREELLPYYRRAHPILELGAFEYDPGYWEQRLNRSEARFLPLDGNRSINLVAQLSPPTRFGPRYSGDLDRSTNVTTYLNATVTEIETPDHGRQVTALQVRTLAGSGLRVIARIYILASGSIENARLLLASNRYQPAGVGNQNDVVGRYYMDHPRIRGSSIALKDPKSFAAIYDEHVTFTGGTVTDGIKIAGFLGLTPETQRAERLGNTRCYLLSRFVCDSDSDNYAALLRLYFIRHRPEMQRSKYPAAIIDVLRKLPKSAILAIGLKYKPRILGRGYMLETVVEPSPSPDSRVTLGSESDALGLRRAKVDWRVGALEKRTFRRTQEIIGAELEKIGAGTIRVDVPGEEESWQGMLLGCWHQMGTTRMHADPRRGVVDATCRVHGMENLYIAGSSVFPTCGSDMPTITVVALALRLADHIKAQFKTGVAWDRSREWQHQSQEQVG